MNLQDLLRLTPLSSIYWTLSLEIQLYLVFALLLAIAHRFRSDSADRRCLLILSDDRVCMAVAVGIDMGNGIFQAIHHP